MKNNLKADSATQILGTDSSLTYVPYATRSFKNETNTRKKESPTSYLLLHAQRKAACCIVICFPCSLGLLGTRSYSSASSLDSSMASWESEWLPLVPKA